MNTIRSWVAEHEPFSFFLLTFIISWGTWIPLARFYFREDVYAAGVPISWGLFGPALAGILTTRLLNPGREGNRRKRSVLVFFLGWALSALVWISFTYFQMGAPLDHDVLVVVVILGLLIAIPAAYVISSAFGVNRDVREYLQSLIKPRGALIYYLIALLIPPLTYWIGSLLSDALGQPPYWSPSPPQQAWHGVFLLLLAFFYQFCFANVLGEEVGWRGFVLPKLQVRYSPLLASLVIAPVWFAWHLPIKLANPDVIPYLFYGLTFIPSAIFLTWIYNRTGGSILAAGFAHIAGNLCGKYLFPITDGMLAMQFILGVILILVDRMWEKKSQPRSVVREGVAG